MSENVLHLPTKAVINSWEDLDNMPLREVVPASSPQSIFVRLPSEDYYNHQVYSKVPLTAAKEIHIIQDLDEFSKECDKYIAKLYSRRSVSKALLSLVERQETKKQAETPEETAARDARAEKIRNAAKPLFDEIYSLLDSFQKFTTDVVSHLGRLLGNKEIWNAGLYSPALLTSFVKLFYRLATLDEIRLVKSSLSNDLTHLLSYTNSGLENKTQQYPVLRNWLSNEFSIENELTEFTDKIPAETRKLVFDIFWAHITTVINKKIYIFPEDLYANIRTLIFMLHFCKPDAKSESTYKNYMLTQCAEHPLIPMSVEISQSFEDIIRKQKIFTNFHAKPKPFDFIGNLKNLQHMMMELPTESEAAAQNSIPQQQYFETIIQTIQLIGTTKNAVREQLMMKLVKPPPHETIASPYERSMRYGYSQEDLKILLKTIAAWRALNDTLRDRLPLISKTLNSHIEFYFQDFVKNQLERFLIHTKKQRDVLAAIIDPLREILGDWLHGEDRGGKQTKTKQMVVHEIPPRLAPPSPAAIELARIQVSHVIHPGFELMKLVKNGFSYTRAIQDKDIEVIAEFVDKTAMFEDMLRLDDLVAVLGDQSDLYFHEIQLDMNPDMPGNMFPIRTSLPFILSEFALRVRTNPEITELIFYPLAIYDDAAMRAIQTLHSKMLLDEIKMEASICLSTLSTLISNFTFDAFRTFATVNSIPPGLQASIRKSLGSNWPESRAYRLTTMIQQNTFYLHGALLDMRSIIIRNVDLQMVESVGAAVGLFQKLGIAGAIAVARTLGILKETYRMLCEQGLQLMPFDRVLSSVLGNASPAAFGSTIVQALVKDISHTVAGRCYMRSNPTRLVISSASSLPLYPLGGGFLGRSLKIALESTTTMITIEHVSSIIRMLDAGSVAVFVGSLIEEFEQKFEKFTNLYNVIRPKLGRIKDDPLGTPGTLVYDRFEGAYKYFTTDAEVDSLFKAMKSLGNILSFASLIDVSILMKRKLRQQVIEVIRGKNSEGYSDEVCNLLGNESSESDLVRSLVESTKSSDAYHPVLTRLLQALVSQTERHLDVFAEKSSTILQFGTLTGFASAWSVLEFVFIVAEAIREDDVAQSPFKKYGEGTMLFAGAMLAATCQERLYDMTAIGRKLEAQRDIDFASTNDERLARFCAVLALEEASLKWALSTVGPIVQHVRYN